MISISSALTGVVTQKRIVFVLEVKFEVVNVSLKRLDNWNDILKQEL